MISCDVELKKKNSQIRGAAGPPPNPAHTQQNKIKIKYTSLIKFFFSPIKFFFSPITFFSKFKNRGDIIGEYMMMVGDIWIFFRERKRKKKRK